MEMSGGDGHKMGYTSMTFFWGKNSEILFAGWPATNGGHYALALIVCFFSSFLVEYLSCCRLTRPGWSDAVVGSLRAAMYAVRAGLSYLVMLALMSFNGGVFLAIVAGDSVAFALFGCWKKVVDGGFCDGSDLPPKVCC